MESIVGERRPAAPGGDAGPPQDGGAAAGSADRADPAGRADASAHDLLVGLAGRLPDRLLWRLRDWLGAGAHTALRTALPRTLLRHRVGVTEAERGLLRDVVTAWGGAPRAVDAVLPATTAPEAGATFAADGERPGWDALDLVLRAAVPGMGEVVEVRRAWRADRAARRAVAAPTARVVLVVADGPRPALTAAVQRLVRAHGEVPRVEVLDPSTPRSPYHRDALAGSTLLWGSAPTPRSGTGAAPVLSPAPAAELVGRG